ncbi:MAG: hypothetical protein LBE36_01845 [Flavobacteriaceae bacterium]|jgi:hypothetical protein|nr:hypothetical protein [Flavobacteriaceae bacterium]
MLKNYLKLKITLLIRSGNSSLDVAFLFLALLGFLFFFNAENADWYAVVSIGIIFLYHFTRKDIGFLKNVLGKEYYFICVAEYLLIWLFVNVFFIFKTDNYLFLWSITVCFIVPAISFKKYFFNPFFIDYVPAILIEWKSYFRKNLTKSLLFIVFSVFCGYHSATLFLCLFFWIDFLFRIYSPIESKELLTAQFSMTDLRKKSFYSSVFCIFLSIPMFVTFCVLNFSQLEYLFYYVLYIFISNYIIIINKYANFNEKTKNNIAVNDADSLKFMLLIITIIPALFYIYNEGKKAEKKIKNYV